MYRQQKLRHTTIPYNLLTIRTFKSSETLLLLINYKELLYDGTFSLYTLTHLFFGVDIIIIIVNI
jgi:hypothetical protein